jgi:hypothetical protein
MGRISEERESNIAIRDIVRAVAKPKNSSKSLREFEDAKFSAVKVGLLIFSVTLGPVAFVNPSVPTVVLRQRLPDSSGSSSEVFYPELIVGARVTILTAGDSPTVRRSGGV